MKPLSNKNNYTTDTKEVACMLAKSIWRTKLGNKIIKTQILQNKKRYIIEHNIYTLK